MTPKYEKVLALATHVIRLDTQLGHLRWKVTDLSRHSRTPRSRVYELLGRNKPEMLKTALQALLEELYGISAERLEYDKTNRFQGLVRSRQIVMQAPELLGFYFRHRGRRDEIGELIRKNEDRFLKHLATSRGIKDEATLIFVRTVIHGISLAPFLDEAQVSRIIKKLAEIE